MRDGIRLLFALFLTAWMIVGCSGGGATGSPPVGVSPSPGGPTEPTTSDAAPTATTGGSATDACNLVPDGELAGILGVASVTTEVIPGPPDTCDIQVDGAPVAAFVYTPSGARMVYDIYAADSQSQEIPGIGDGAIFNSTTQLLVVLKGDSMVSIAVFDDGSPEADRLEVMKQLGAIAAGRM